MKKHMKVSLACLADAVSPGERGKVSLIGVFDTIAAERFPLTYPHMSLAVRLHLEHEDGDKKHSAEVILRDEDHRKIMDGKIQFAANRIEPGQFGSASSVVELHGLVFRRPGRYHVAIVPDEGEEYRIPLQVVELKKAS